MHLLVYNSQCVIWIKSKPDTNMQQDQPTGVGHYRFTRVDYSEPT